MILSKFHKEDKKKQTYVHLMVKKTWISQFQSSEINKVEWVYTKPRRYETSNRIESSNKRVINNSKWYIKKLIASVEEIKKDEIKFDASD